MTVRQFLLLVSFTVLLFIVILFSDTSARWIVSGMVAAYFSIFFIRKDVLNKFENYSGLMMVWCLWVISILISTVFSHSIPLSLEELPLLLVPWLVFWTVLGSKKFQSNFFLNLLTICFASLAITASLFQFILLLIPGLGSSLPALSILYAHYGHAHISALHILLYPFIWKISYQQHQKGNSRWILLIFIVALSVFFSASRVNILLLFIQQVVLTILYLRKNGATFLRFISGGMTSLLVIGLLLFSIGSFKVVSANTWFCNLPALGQNMCKLITQETRPEYWSQAIRAIDSYPVFGYGPGTFMLISQRFRSFPHTTTTYAHNLFLHRFSEDGLISGSLYLFLLFVIIVTSLKVIFDDCKKNREFSFRVAAAFGFISFFIAGFFDYDWQLMGLNLIAMLCAAIVMQGSSGQFISLARSRLFFLFSKILFISMTILIVTISAISISTNANIFPWFYYQRHHLIDEGSDKQKLKYFDLYKAHPDIVKALYRNENDELQKAILIEKLQEIDPWSVLNQRASTHYFTEGNLSAAYRNLVTTSIFVLDKEKNTSYVFEYSFKQELAHDLISYTFLNKDTLTKEEMLDTLILAQKLDYWILQSEDVDFLFNESISSEKLVYLLPDLLQDGNVLGINENNFQLAYLRAFEQLLLSRQVAQDQADVFVNYWKNADLSRYQASYNLFQEELWKKSFIASQLGDENLVDEIIMQWQILQNSSKIYGENSGFFDKEKQAENLLRIATQLHNLGNSNISKYYLLAWELSPGIFDSESIWLDSAKSRSMATHEQITSYANFLVTNPSFTTRADVHVPFIVFAAEKSLDENQIEKLLSTLTRFNPTGYWEQSMLGHWYLSQGRFKEARDQYISCLDKNPQHYVCQQGLQKAELEEKTSEYYDLGVKNLDFKY